MYILLCNISLSSIYIYCLISFYIGKREENQWVNFHELLHFAYFRYIKASFLHPCLPISKERSRNNHFIAVAREIEGRS